MARKSIRKMGTRAGQPHYGVTCRMCPGNYGRDYIVVVAHLSKDAAESSYAAHVKLVHA